MRNILFVLVPIFLLISCGPTKQNTAIYSEDKLFEDAVKNLDKNPSNSELSDKLQTLYRDAAQNHLKNIELYETMTEPTRWDKIVAEYNALQRLYTIIHKSTNAQNQVKPVSYIAQTDLVKQDAAEDFYQMGRQLMVENRGKQSYRDAFAAFKKASSFVTNYKDVSQQMEVAWKSSVLNVLIDPVKIDDRYALSGGQGNTLGQFNGQLLQNNLVQDLGGDFSNNSYARYYTNSQIRYARIDPDWLVDLTWVKLDIPKSSIDKSTKTLTKTIESGKDSTGRVTYETVTGILTIIKYSLKATGSLELRITDAFNRREIHSKRHMARGTWGNRYATYTGDSRALSDADRKLINSPNEREPRTDEMIEKLYSDVYFQIKSSIENLVKTTN